MTIKLIHHTPKPLTLMGIAASACWNSNPSDPSRIGINCIESGHGRVLEYPDIVIEIDGYSARVVREIYTHIIGTTRLQASTRYIEYGEFDYITPNSVARNNQASEIYHSLMLEIQDSYKKLVDLGIPKEDIANILPLGMTSKMVLKINARALLHMAEERECTRAYWEFRKFMKELKEVLSKLDEEWAKIVSYAKPKCEVWGVCKEAYSCGRVKKASGKTKEEKDC